MSIPLRTVLLGDALQQLKTLPDGCVDLVVSSPPYYNLRNYGTPPVIYGGDPGCEHDFVETERVRRSSDSKPGAKSSSNPGSIARDVPVRSGTCSKCGAWEGDLGMEPTVDLFVANLVSIMREVWRVLKPTGVVFINIADSYASGKGSCLNPGGGKDSLGQQRKADGAHPTHRGNKSELAAQKIRPKSQMLIPERFRIAMQLDGWICRDAPVWVKGREYADDDVGMNPMPGSQKDRCTSAYEFVYMFTKEERYFFDWQAIAEPPRESSIARLGQDVEAQTGSTRANGGGKTNGNMKAVLSGSFARSTKYGDSPPPGQMPQHRADRENIDYNSVALVMPRNVWIFPTRGYKGSHYATFPPELPRRCILVGSSAHGCCSACGKPWVRVSKAEIAPGQNRNPQTEREQAGCAVENQGSKRHRDGDRGGHMVVEQQGWQPTCTCDAPVSPAVILDPFMGSGTTAQVAEELGRDWIGIDLDARNMKLVEERLAKVRGPLFVEQHG